MPAKVLVVEDDPHAIELVRLYLSRDGHDVITASDGLEGLRLARETHPDLLVLDLMLPGMDGLEICRIIREETDIPVIMLTARVEEEDRLSGLDLGADDYVTKPFSPRELAARVRAVLRRTSRDSLENGPAELTYQGVTVNLRGRSVSVGGTPVQLTPTEFRLLATLIKEPGRAFTRELLIDRAFGYDFEGFDRTVDAHISSLRRKIETMPPKSRYIHTVYGLGYRFGNS
ncbi:MAG: response regulator transcription factor [Chloroflexi bacterium]|nr:response regulator transcription factor [Chloroflexota bacterium]MDA1219330.1 response regulator transcription factor [Chloroflexota bacterium]PKB57456.1 MAG: DNA-binding response regulator [SAR202 cluster bacterium Casp-Chloro-G3]